MRSAQSVQAFTGLLTGSRSPSRAFSRALKARKSFQRSSYRLLEVIGKNISAPQFLIGNCNLIACHFSSHYWLFIFVFLSEEHIVPNFSQLMNPSLQLREPVKTFIHFEHWLCIKEFWMSWLRKLETLFFMIWQIENSCGLRGYKDSVKYAQM